MSTFIVLRKTNEKGTAMNPERWNTNQIQTYREWTSTDSKKKLSVVFVGKTEASPKGRIIVDNTVEELDAVCGVSTNKKQEK